MTTLLVVEDEAMLRTALVSLLENAGYQVPSVDSGDAVIAAVDECEPDGVLLDIRLPGRDGIDLAHELGARRPPPKLLLMTSVARPAAIARALDAPIDALLLKSSTAVELLSAVAEVLGGGHVVDADLLALATRARPDLTDRELDLLRAAADGAPLGEVAVRLHLAPATVRNHITSILAKTATRNRFEAVQRARDAEWI